MDGILLSRSGRGIETLNPRQMCNFAYALLLENKDQEERDTFLFELSMPLDPMEAADVMFSRMKTEGAPG